MRDLIHLDIGIGRGVREGGGEREKEGRIKG